MYLMMKSHDRTSGAIASYCRAFRWKLRQATFNLQGCHVISSYFKVALLVVLSYGTLKFLPQIPLRNEELISIARPKSEQKQNHQISVTFGNRQRPFERHTFAKTETKFSWIKFDWRRLYFSIKHLSSPPDVVDQSHKNHYRILTPSEKRQKKKLREGFRSAMRITNNSLTLRQWNFRISERIRKRHFSPSTQIDFPPPVNTANAANPLHFSANHARNYRRGESAETFLARAF